MALYIKDVSKEIHYDKAGIIIRQPRSVCMSICLRRVETWFVSSATVCASLALLSRNACTFSWSRVIRSIFRIWQRAAATRFLARLRSSLHCSCSSMSTFVGGPLTVESAAVDVEKWLPAPADVEDDTQIGNIML